MLTGQIGKFWLQNRENGDSTVDLELRVWIGDPENGIQNVISDILIATWNLFQEHNIEFPYPQQDVHLRSLPVGLSLLDREGCNK